MDIIYLCPHCRGAINAKKNIILSAKASGTNAGLALLHEEIGNYTVAMSPTLKIESGDVVDFYCPICHTSLNTPKGENMARFIRVDELGNETNVIISRKYGERCTFTIDDQRKVKSYGESVRKYLDPEWYL
ncbi:MAG: hypothetical protein JW731_00415 [Bacteroidales bacterium]|nr:hypothetical protein [Bacteroidales bacterium]